MLSIVNLSYAEKVDLISQRNTTTLQYRIQSVGMDVRQEQLEEAEILLFFVTVCKLFQILRLPRHIRMCVVTAMIDSDAVGESKNIVRLSTVADMLLTSFGERSSSIELAAIT